MRCLCCGREMSGKTSEMERESRWHKRCIKAFFGTNTMPVLDLTEEGLVQLASRMTGKGLTVPGVQKKLSLHLSQDPDCRLTIVDYPTGYILKPQTSEYPYLPEFEDLVMRQAKIAGIRTVPNALIRVGSENAYITRRVDRQIGQGQVQMYAMEDFCQLSGRLTEDKYKGSYERCSDLITQYSMHPGLDLAEFFLRIVFSFIIGNSDMHLKNFSLREMTPGKRDFILSDAYDLLPVNIVLPTDKEQTALTLNGKKRNLRKKDFIALALRCDLAEKTALRMIAGLIGKREKLEQQIDASFLPESEKAKMRDLMEDRIEVLL